MKKLLRRTYFDFPEKCAFLMIVCKIKTEELRGQKVEPTNNII